MPIRVEHEARRIEQVLEVQTGGDVGEGQPALPQISGDVGLASIKEIVSTSESVLWVKGTGIHTESEDNPLEVS